MILQFLGLSELGKEGAAARELIRTTENLVGAFLTLICFILGGEECLSWEKESE